MKIIKKLIIYISIFFPVYKGFKVSEAVKYFEAVYNDLLKNKKYSLSEKIRAYRKGFLPEILDNLESAGNNSIAAGLSLYDYHYIYPVNDIFSKWFKDIVTTRNVLKPFKQYMPEFYYHLYIRDMEPMIIKLADCPGEYTDTFDGILNLIQKKGKVCVLRKTGTVSGVIEYREGNYLYDGKVLSGHELAEQLEKDIKKETRVITEYVGGMESAAAEGSGFVRTYVYNKYADNARIGQANLHTAAGQLPVDTETGEYAGGTVNCWDEIKEVIRKMGLFIPQIELAGIDIVLTGDTFKFIRFTDHPEYPSVIPFNDEMQDYFKLKVAQKKEQAKLQKSKKTNFIKIINSFFWTCMTKIFCPPEMRPLIYKWWYITVKEDLFSRNGVSLKDKIWAYKHGYLSYRLPQYGITRDNFRNYISDYDYRYIRHINNEYRTWLEDKLTVKYICSEHSQYFPEYYYHFSVRNGQKRLIPLMDLPEYCDNQLEAIFTLVENKGALACKPQKGSQGKGFYKFSYENGKYYLNHEEVTKQQVIDILDDGESQYFVTEYIAQHQVINDVYSGAVNTLRIITFMKDGKHPEIGNAYMRFGSRKTGAVDNMGAGGMFAQVDMETGRFFNGKIITENSIETCPAHPDTGAPIEGYLPNWDVVKNGIIELCYDMPQLEYLGFDVAITADGMKLPEINRAPGYPKIEKFNRATNEYLLYKREMKMKRNNITKTKW